MAGSGAQWAGWSDAGIVNATTAGGAIGSLVFGGDWYNGASLGFSIGALNHTGDDDNNRYDRNEERDVLKMMPWQQPYDYNMSYSNQVGFIDTGVDYVGKGWSALSTHTKSKLTWEAFKFCPYGQKSIKNLFYNLRLHEPEIFLSRQAPKIILMIFHDFCSAGA